MDEISCLLGAFLKMKIGARGRGVDVQQGSYFT